MTTTLRGRTTAKQTIVDVVSGSLTYSGEADLGVATTANGWKIKSIATSGGVTTTSYPIGKDGYPTDEQIFAWSERDHYNYSLTPDTTAPTLSTVTIASDNTTTTLAKVGDTVTLTIVASEAIKTPTATIGAGSATIVAGVDALHWTATRVMTSSDTEGTVTFSIAFEDLGGLAGTTVTALTGGSAVTFDKTAPTASLLYSVNGGTDYYSTLTVKDADTLRIKATFSEAVKDSPAPKLAIDNSVLSASSMTKTNTTTYYYDLNVPTGNIATATCSLSVGQDLAGNVITSAPTANATFTIDNTAPTFTGTSVTSNNADTTLGKSGDIVTAVFTTSETLASNPTVTLGGQSMSYSTKVGSTYTYTRTLNGSETEGTCNVLVTGTDIAGNTTTDTNVGHVHTDFTAPTMSSVVKNSVTELEVTLSTVVAASTITKANAGGFTVTETSGVPTYAVSAIAPGTTNNKVKLTVANMTASAAAGVTVTYTSGGNGTVADVTGNLMATDGTGVATGAF